MKKFLLLLVILYALSGYAQDEIETAPDQYENPSVAPPGRFQMENRFTVQDNGKNKHSLILPSTNWKFGINENVEIIMVTDLVYDKTPDNTTSGLQPLKFGLKIKLWDGKKLLPDAALSIQASFPKLASDSWKANYVAPNIRLLLKNKVSDKIGIGTNLGAVWDGDNPEAQFFYTVSPKYKLSQKLECFVESYGYISGIAKPEHWVDGGLMYLITNDLQAEISAGYELTQQDDAHRYFGLLGLALRI